MLVLPLGKVVKKLKSTPSVGHFVMTNSKQEGIYELEKQDENLLDQCEYRFNH